MGLKFALGLLAGVTASAFASGALADTACEGLAQIHAAGATLTVAKTVDVPADISKSLEQAKLSTPLCRVAGFISPTKDSHIGFEVWMPVGAAWNHKLQAVGNGGLLGFLNYRAMVAGFNRGYATMTTDLGHTNTPPGSAEDATWALGHPEKVVDYAYRGEHLASLAAKAIVQAYYGAAPSHAYYTGCSAGGIAGLNEALRYPTDYDGYVIGDATPDHLAQEMGAMANTLAASLSDPANALKDADMTLAHKAVLADCAGKDGGLAGDPFLTDPTACKFDPQTIACAAGQAADACLTPAKVAIFRKIYEGLVDPRTHEPILAGLTPGTELGWNKYFTGKTNPVDAGRPWAGFLTDMVYQDPNYLTQEKYLTLDPGRDYRAVQQAKPGGESIGSSWTTPSMSLEPVRAEGAKVIQYHGWDDPNIPALESLKLFETNVADQARRHGMTHAQALEATRKFYRLFVVQGMGHCTGGDGPFSFGQNGQRPLKDDPEHDTMLALERWVEKGEAPDQFIGAHLNGKTGAVDMTRPICAYPNIPVWKGEGDTNDAASFRCVAPRPAASR